MRRAFFILALVLFANPGWGAEPARADQPAGEKAAPNPALEAALEKLNLPGIAINLKERCVDVDATICLDNGMLELIACTKGTKEHESIVTVGARPAHIHAALLLLGAKNGSPAMRRPTNKEQTEWVDVPPHGDPVEVSLVWKDAKGIVVERPISDFITHHDSEGNEAAREKKKVRFPNTFVFAGSLLGEPDRTPREYIAESSGDVISISTFGDELLCLPNIEGQDNASLEWQIDPTHLPKLHSKVTLRLRVKKPKQ
jgi:hypothetical protein